jgi:hypothetical protein
VPSLKSKNAFHVLSCHLGANRSLLPKFHQILRFQLKFDEIWVKQDTIASKKALVCTVAPARAPCHDSFKTGQDPHRSHFFDCCPMKGALYPSPLSPPTPSSGNSRLYCIPTQTKPQKGCVSPLPCLPAAPPPLRPIVHR